MENISWIKQLYNMICQVSDHLRLRAPQKAGNASRDLEFKVVDTYSRAPVCFVTNSQRRSDD